MLGLVTTDERGRRWRTGRQPPPPLPLWEEEEEEEEEGVQDDDDDFVEGDEESDWDVDEYEMGPNERDRASEKETSRRRPFNNNGSDDATIQRTTVWRGCDAKRTTGASRLETTTLTTRFGRRQSVERCGGDGDHHQPSSVCGRLERRAGKRGRREAVFERAGASRGGDEKRRSRRRSCEEDDEDKARARGKTRSVSRGWVRGVVRTHILETIESMRGAFKNGRGISRGMLQRFCQKCTRFHSIDEFKDKRRVRAALSKLAKVRAPTGGNGSEL